MVAIDSETKNVEPVGEPSPASPVETSYERASSPSGEGMVEASAHSYPEQFTGHIVDQIV